MHIEPSKTTGRHSARHMASAKVSSEGLNASKCSTKGTTSAGAPLGSAIASRGASTRHARVRSFGGDGDDAGGLLRRATDAIKHSTLSVANLDEDSDDGDGQDEYGDTKSVISDEDDEVDAFDDEEEQEMSDFDDDGTGESELGGSNSTAESSLCGDGLDGSPLEKALELLKSDDTFDNDPRWSGLLKKSPIVASMFDDGDAVLYFPHEGETVQGLPKVFQKVLSWKVCKFTPKVVRNTLRRAGFRLVKGGVRWIGYWGKHFPVDRFKTIQPWQKINHFPMSFELGRKDRMYINMTTMRERVGVRSVDFIPQSFLLPHQRRNLKSVFNDHPIWIVKPPASARGQGIRLVSRWSDLPKKREVIVSRYIANPFLIDRKKFDLRLYVAVTSFDPLRIYLFKEGIVRFAADSSSSKPEKLKNRYAHLTNYSVARKGKLLHGETAAKSRRREERYESELDEKFSTASCKWGFDTLKEYFDLCGINFDEVMDRIKAIIVKTIISANTVNASGVRLCVPNSASCYELFGFDVLLDEDLKPWLMEVNISPSLKASSDMDYGIKSRLVTDLFNLVGIRVKDLEQSRRSKYRENCKRAGLSGVERRKHREHYRDKSFDCLSDLTPDDMRVLKDSEDEHRRRGNFERVYPTKRTDEYLNHKYTSVSYYDRLLQQWTARTSDDPLMAISLLRGLPTLDYASEKVLLPTTPVQRQQRSKNGSATAVATAAITLNARAASPLLFGRSGRPPSIAGRAVRNSVPTSSRSSITTLVGNDSIATPGRPLNKLHGGDEERQPIRAGKSIDQTPSFVDRLYPKPRRQKDVPKAVQIEPLSDLDVNQQPSKSVVNQQPKSDPSGMIITKVKISEGKTRPLVEARCENMLTTTGGGTDAAAAARHRRGLNLERDDPVKERDYPVKVGQAAFAESAFDDMVDCILRSSKACISGERRGFSSAANDLVPPPAESHRETQKPNAGQQHHPSVATVRVVAKRQMQFNAERTLRGPEPGYVAEIIARAARLRSINHAFSTMRRSSSSCLFLAANLPPPGPPPAANAMEGGGGGASTMLSVPEDDLTCQGAGGQIGNIDDASFYLTAEEAMHMFANVSVTGEMEGEEEEYHMYSESMQEAMSLAAAKDRDIDDAEPLFPSWKTERRYGRRVKEAIVRKEEKAVHAVAEAAARTVLPAAVAMVRKGIRGGDHTAAASCGAPAQATAATDGGMQEDRVTPWLRSVPSVTGGGRGRGAVVSD